MQPHILVADDHIMISKGLRMSLEIHFGYTEVYSVTSCNRLLEELKKKKYSHLILDIGLSDGSALEILPYIKHFYSHLRILIFSGKSAEAYKRSLEQYGIHNFLSKEQDETDTIRGLRKFFLDERIATADPQNINPFSRITAREMEILHYILQGMGSNEIGRTLGLKHNTVSGVKNRIFEKTQTTNIRELIELAQLYKIT